MTMTLARHRYWWTPAGQLSHLGMQATPHVEDLVRTACGRWVRVSSRRMGLPPYCAECRRAER